MLKKIKKSLLEKSGSFQYYKNHYENEINKENEAQKKIDRLTENLKEQEKQIMNLKIQNSKLMSQNDNINYPVENTVSNNHTKYNKKLSENYPYTFSIIIPCYNSNKYLDECINSIINQTINFNKNIQIILIDDGSTDETIKTISKYSQKYPENIYVYTQDHKGQSAARNKGIENAQGEYINFLDSDDYLSTNTLQEVYKIFNEYGNKVELVSIPIKKIERNNEYFVLNNKFESKDEIFDLNTISNYVESSVTNTFIKTELIKNNKIYFDEKCNCFEDTLFVNNALNCMKYVAICKSAHYYYRKRADFSSIKDEKINKNELNPKLFKILCDKIFDCSTQINKPYYIQNLIIYYIKEVIEKFSDDLSNEKKVELKNVIKYILTRIDIESIISSNILNNSLKTFILYLKNNETIFDETNNQNNDSIKINKHIEKFLDKQELYINKVETKGENLFITGFLTTFLKSDTFNLEILKEKKNNEIEKFVCDIYNMDSNNYSYLNIDWNYYYPYNIEIPIDAEQDLKYFFKINVNSLNNSFDTSLHYNLFNEKLSNNQLVLTPYSLDLQKDSLTIKREFKFSIIIAVYNTGKYLYETIDSLINQTIGFENNIQLILVDDGSKDESKQICLEYQKKYPKNIIVLSQKNSGQAVARNNGLRQAEGEFINFLDSDDYLSSNTLEDVYKFFSLHKSEIDMVAIPIKMFERLNNYHILQPKFNTERVIDLKKEPNNPQLSASSAFFKKELFPQFEFAEDMVTSEDSIMINKILLEKQKYGVINTATYFYRKRYDSSSTIDNSIGKKEFYTEKLTNYFMALQGYSYNKLGEIPLFIQYLIAYDIQWLLKEPELTLLNETEKKEFMKQVKTIVSKLDTQVVTNNIFIKDEIFKTYFLYLITGNYQVNILEDNVKIEVNSRGIDQLKNRVTWIDIVEIKDDYLNISGFVNSYFNSDKINIVATKEDTEGNITEYIGKKVEYTVREDIQFLEQKWQYKYNYDIQIPLEEYEKSSVKLKIRYLDENHIITCDLKMKLTSGCRLSNKSKYIANESHILSYNEKSLELEGYEYKKVQEYNEEVCKIIKEDQPKKYNELIKIRKKYTFLDNIKRKYYKKPIYLFMDRVNHADDNAEHLFKYAVKQKDNVIKYFAVDNDDDYKRLKKIGKVVKYNSFKHRLIYLLADKVISSHPDDFVLNPFFGGGADQRIYMSSLITSKIYFLQHGATLGNVSDWLRKFDKNVSLIVSISEKEHDSFLEKGYNYDENIIQILGFPRYDNLSNEPKKQILIIPTWRNYLEYNEDIFKNSSYFENISELLNNEELINKLKEMNYKLVFKPHPRLENKIPHSDKKFIDLFEINENIEIPAGKSYQELFKESNVLITDYSSVAFDFAYLKKPIIYFQPDDDYHHGKGYFDFETMGFGEVIKDKEKMLNKLYDYLDNNCKMEEKYIERVNQFFKYTDKNNSKRVYDWIKEH